MSIVSELIGRAGRVLAVLALGYGAGVGWGQTDGADAASGVTFTTLRGLDSQAYPLAGLVQGTDGDLYGTTALGGTNCSNAGGCGTIFKITPSGALTTVYSFCNQTSCADGEYPYASLVQATNGELYGTTLRGGVYCEALFESCGTIFKISPLLHRIDPYEFAGHKAAAPGGTLTTLYRFCAEHGCPDGQAPYVGLVQAADGNLYGTTTYGGVGSNCASQDDGCGTVFRITMDGTLTTLYSFCFLAGCADGANPGGALIQATDGNLYGTTMNGGAGAGTVFRITPSGTLQTLYTFCSQSHCADGENPQGSLVQALDGNLYGTTQNGGAGDAGTIFKISLNGAFATIHSFCLQVPCADGTNPIAGLVQASDGKLYGLTSLGGATGSNATIFRISHAGMLTVLYTFCTQDSCEDGQFGQNPQGGLVQATDGKFYGTTSIDAAVFSLSVGLGPFVKMLPTMGVAGEMVTILGYGLSGTTSVTFNGTPATVFYGTATVIHAQVPAGAKTGNIHVVTPSGTLTSNVAFEVLP
jgi:uncharacterized repeat protein (TIGR03803 family)